MLYAQSIEKMIGIYNLVNMHNNYIYSVIPKRYNINGNIIGQKYMLKPMTFFLATKITSYEKNQVFDTCTCTCNFPQ